MGLGIAVKWLGAGPRPRMASFIGKRMGISVAIAEGSRQSLAQHHAGWLSLHGIVAESSKRTISRVQLEVPDD